MIYLKAILIWEEEMTLKRMTTVITIIMIISIIKRMMKRMTRMMIKRGNYRAH